MISHVLPFVAIFLCFIRVLSLWRGLCFTLKFSHFSLFLSELNIRKSLCTREFYDEFTLWSSVVKILYDCDRNLKLVERKRYANEIDPKIKLNPTEQNFSRCSRTFRTLHSLEMRYKSLELTTCFNYFFLFVAIHTRPIIKIVIWSRSIMSFNALESVIILTLPGNPTR